MLLIYVTGCRAPHLNRFKRFQCDAGAAAWFTSSLTWKLWFCRVSLW
jgi:hypothetical protein